MAEASIPAPRQAARRRAPKRLLALRSDDQLVARVRQGDELAFEVLYERYVPGILSFCRHMLGSSEEAEDAVQHAFAAAHGGLLRDERDVDFKPWLYAIARNRSLSLLRARRETADAEPEVSTAGLEGDVGRRADLRALVADLQDLPPDQREALVLTELEDLSHAQVAEVLDCPVASVKGLVFRARSGLMERRDARTTPCEEIRAELATARKGSLRKSKLRHHLKDCVGCSAYLEDVRRQRRMLAVLLPVIPSVGLKRSVLASCGLGGAGGAGAGTAGLIGGSAPLVTGAATKVAIAGAIAGAAALGGGAATEQFGGHEQSPAPGQVKQGGHAAPAHGVRRSHGASAGGDPAGRSRTKSRAKASAARGRAKSKAKRRGAAAGPPSSRGKAAGRVAKSKLGGARGRGGSAAAVARPQRSGPSLDHGPGTVKPVAPEVSPLQPQRRLTTPRAKSKKAPPER